MTEAEAEQRAKELNLQLGAQGNDLDYHMPVQAEDGSWGVEKRRSKPSWFARIIDAIPP